MKKSKKRIPKCYSMIFPVAILFASFFLCIGYAKINNVNLVIDGNLETTIPNEIYVYEASIVSGTNGANVANSSISSYAQKLVTSNISLSNDNIDSTITMQVKLKNNSGYDYNYNDTIYSLGFYDNLNIDYSVSGINKNDVFLNGDVLSLLVTFKYSDTYKNSSPSVPYANTLNSTLEFDFSDNLFVNVTVNGLTTTPPSSSLIANKNSTYTLDVGGTNYNFVITMSGNRIYNFTYENGILSIPNVDGDIVINAFPKEELAIFIDDNTNTGTQNTNTTTLTDLYNVSVNGGNYSNKTINKVTLNAVYTINGGNTRQTTIVTLSYMLNGVQKTHTGTLAYSSKTANSTATVVFSDGVSIPVDTPFSITHSVGNVNSGNIAVASETVTVDFATN